MTIKLDREKTLKFVIDDRGNPFMNAIVLLEDLIGSYNKLYTKDDSIIADKVSQAIKIDYKDLENRLGLNYNKIRLAFRRLERKYQLVKRDMIFNKDDKGKVKGGSKTFARLYLSNIENLEDNC